MQGQFLLNKLQGMEKKKPFSVLAGSVMKRNNLNLQPSEELYWPVIIMSRSQRQTQVCVVQDSYHLALKLENKKFPLSSTGWFSIDKANFLIDTAADFFIINCLIDGKNFQHF